MRPAVAAALADSEQAARQVREALTAGGVAPRDAATGNVSISTEEDYSGQRGPRLLGYRADHTLTVVLRDLAVAGRVLGEAVAAGGGAGRVAGGGVPPPGGTQPGGAGPAPPRGARRGAGPR